MSWFQTRFERHEHPELTALMPRARPQSYLNRQSRDRSPIVLHSVQILVRHHQDADTDDNADHGSLPPPILPDVFVDPQSLNTTACSGRSATVGCFVCFEALPVVALRCGHVMCGACYTRWTVQAGYVCWMCRQRVAGAQRIFLEAGPTHASGTIEETSTGGPGAHASPESSSTSLRSRAVSQLPDSATHLATWLRYYDGHDLGGPLDGPTLPDTDGPRAAD
jgi:hypothetical protein